MLCLFHLISKNKTLSLISLNNWINSKILLKFLLQWYRNKRVRKISFVSVDKQPYVKILIWINMYLLYGVIYCRYLCISSVYCWQHFDFNMLVIYRLNLYYITKYILLYNTKLRYEIFYHLPWNETKNFPYSDFMDNDIWWKVLIWSNS